MTPLGVFICVPVPVSVPIRSSVVKMADLTFKDQRSDMSSGSPDMLSKVADVARGAACNIYSKSPAAFLSEQLPGTPLLDAHRAMMDTLCKDKTPPPALPTPPFKGGQCCGVNYYVFVEADLEVSNGQVLAFNGEVTLNGKIEKVEVTREGTGQNETTHIDIFYMTGVLCDVPQINRPRGTFVNNSNGTTSKIVIKNVTVTRADGQPDTCGDPPGKYPSGDLTVNDFDFITNVEFFPGADVAVNVRVVPTLIVIGNDFSPELTINVGGIDVNISLGGFTFSPNITFNGGDRLPTRDPRPTPPPAKTPKPTSPPPNYKPDLDDIKRRINDLQKELEECCDAKKPHPEPPPQEVEVVTIANGNSGVGVIPPSTYKVTLEITSRPTQEKIQFGMQGADVVYAGWSWFATGNAMGERTTVDALLKVYEPPSRGGDKFHFTLYAGYTAIIRAYYIK